MFVSTTSNSRLFAGLVRRSIAQDVIIVSEDEPEPEPETKAEKIYRLKSETPKRLWRGSYGEANLKKSVERVARGRYR